MDVARLFNIVSRGWTNSSFAKKQVPDGEREIRPLRTQGLPFDWDRPMKGLYADGQIRIFWKDKDGELLFCRMATDEEIKFIMLYELIRDAL